MKNTYFFKIDKALREDQEHIMVDMAYKKGTGYIASALPCSRNSTSFCISIDADYFGKYKPVEREIYPCTRNTEKAKAMAAARFSDAARSLAEQFCKAVYQRCGENITIAE